MRARVRQDAPGAQRPRAELQSPIEPGDDLLIDEIGGAGKPCTWELQLNFTEEADNVDASFYGVREE